MASSMDFGGCPSKVIIEKDGEREEAYANLFAHADMLTGKESLFMGIRLRGETAMIGEKSRRLIAKEIIFKEVDEGESIPIHEIWPIELSMDNAAHLLESLMNEGLRSRFAKDQNEVVRAKQAHIDDLKKELEAKDEIIRTLLNEKGKSRSMWPWAKRETFRKREE